MVVVLLILLKNPFIQTVLARAAANYLEAQLQTTIKISKLDINLLKRITIKDIMILDQRGDTLFSSALAEVRWQHKGLKNMRLKINSILIEDSEIHLRKYLKEENLNFAFILDYFSDTEREPASDTIHADLENSQLKFSKIRIKDCRFIYEDQNDTTTVSGIKYNNIELTINEFETRDVLIAGDSVALNVLQLSFWEKSGFQVNNMSCNLIFSPTILQADSLLLITPKNNIDLDFKFRYDSFSDFNDFIHKIHITTNIRPTRLNLSDVGYFAPVLFRMDNRIDLTAQISGTVDNFKARNLNFSVGENTRFSGNIQMNGLPDFFTTYTHLSILEFYTTADDIASINLPIEGNVIQVPEILDKLDIIKINGKFTGFYNDFVSYANFSTAIGNMKTDILLKVDKGKDVEYTGNFSTRNLNVGKLIENESLIKRVEMSAEIRGHGFDFETMDFIVKGNVNSLEFYNNTYNDIRIAGHLNDKKFDGSVIINDDLIDLNFTGLIDYSSVIPSYKFIAVIDSAQVNQMNIYSEDTLSLFSTRLDIDLSGNQFDNLQGIIKLDNTVYSEYNETYRMDHLLLSVTRDSSNFVLLRLFSDIADIAIEGKFLLTEMPYQLNHFMDQYLDTIFLMPSNPDIHLHEQDFIFEVLFKNSGTLTQLFLPDFRFSPGTMVKGSFNSKTQDLFIEASSDEVEYTGKKFKNWNVEIKNQNSELLLTTGADKFYISDSLSVDGLHALLSIAKDTVLFNLLWENQDWKTRNSGDIEGYLAFHSKNEMDLKIYRGNVIVNDTLWKFNSSNLLKIDTTSFKFKNFGLTSNLQGLRLDGEISTDISDTLIISFDHFDLSNSDPFLKSSNIDLDGYINGDFKVVNVYGTSNYLSDITVSELSFNKEKLGEALIKSTWDTNQEAFNLIAQLIYKGNIGTSKTFEVSGTFYPNRETDNFDIDIYLNNYKLNTLEPFVKDFSSKLQGLASGKLKLSGSTKNPELIGTINLMRTQMKIDFLNVTYFLADQIKFDHNLIHFDQITIYDSLQNKATASGKVHHEYFSNFNFDLNFSANNLLGLNTTKAQNTSFYGSAFATGTVNIAGPPDNLTMKINVTSEKGTSIKIPASLGTEVVENNYIIFLERNDDITDQKVTYKEDVSGITLNLGLNVTHDANIQLFLPYQMGDIQANGKGDLVMDISPAEDFSIKGDYVINRGSFFLTLQKIINRDFAIRRGSKISWTGDPYNAQIDLKAVYKVKTTLGEYGPPEDSATRIQVDCVIALSKNLFNPEIKFTIEFPDLKEDSKQYIYSQLDTTNQALMSQQMISLLLLNSFSYSSGTTGSVGFNTFSLVTNQLNNWLSGFSNNLDIGVNYRPGGQLSSDEVELALSTRLFDDRVTIDGNVGVKGKESASNLIGEVTVEVKITDDGRFRAKVFNKSNNDDLYKNYSPYTQGVGVFYTQDFNRFGDLFRRKNKKTD